MKNAGSLQPKPTKIPVNAAYSVMMAPSIFVTTKPWMSFLADTPGSMSLSNQLIAAIPPKKILVC